MSSEIVIKVKYGDTLRCFNASGKFSMGKLRKKILNLFQFTSDTDFTLTYIDEDNEVVTLVDHNDLRHAINQCHNTLRLNVLLNSNSAGTSDSRSIESSTPLRSLQNPSHSSSHMNSGVAEVLGDLPEPVRAVLTKLSCDLASSVTSFVAELSVPELRHALSKFYIDLVSKAASSAPALAEVVEVSIEDNTAP